MYIYYYCICIVLDLPATTRTLGATSDKSAWTYALLEHPVACEPNEVTLILFFYSYTHFNVNLYII